MNMKVQWILLAVISILVVLTTRYSAANDLRGVFRNNSGVRKFNGKNAAQAFDDFAGALADLPYAGEVHFNIGNSFLIRREYEKALSEYQQAIKTSPGDSRRGLETRFRAYFNSAIALTEMKKNDGALENYQRALDIVPDSVETKTNIELLTAQSSGDGDGGNENDQKDDPNGKGKDEDKKDDKDKDDKDKDKDDKDKDKDKDKKDQKEKGDKPFDNPKATPRPFKSEELSQQDVKGILEELKRQEEQIRARMENEQRKDAPPEKDW